MPIITTEQAIAHCRADPVADAQLLELYLAAALDTAPDYLQRKLYESKEALDAAVLAEEAGELPMVASSSVKAAILLICGHLFENRETVVVGASAAVSLPMGAYDLLRPHRRSFGV